MGFAKIILFLHYTSQGVTIRDQGGVTANLTLKVIAWFVTFVTPIMACVVPFRSRCARLCPPRTEAAMPLSVSVRDGHVSVSAGFARLADRSPARIRPPSLASRGARHAKQRRGK